MTSNYDITRFRSLLAKLPEFAGIAADCVQSLGLEKAGGRGPKGELASDRVIRDYVRRGVLSPTLKADGERGLYGFRHLVEFLAARVLLNRGWPLGKIAQHRQSASEEQLFGLVADEPDDNEALSLVRALRSESVMAVQRVELESFSVQMRSELGPIPGFAESPDQPLIPPDNLASQRRAELPMLMRQITGSIAPPVEQAVVSINLGSRVTLSVDAAYARSISAQDAEAIGRIVATALVNLSTKPNKKDRR